MFFHDINLPVRSPEYAQWGAKFLFDDLDLVKHVDEASDPPNIGSVIVPADKERLRRRLLDIVAAHAWETKAPERITGPLLSA